MTSVIPITNTTIPTPPPPVMPPAAPPPPPPSLPSPPAASSSSTSTAAISEDLGILQPSPDMRAIIDKTASWVARHGTSFEQKVKEKQKDASQFLFLRPGNPYYAYYQQKVREIRRVEVIAEIGDKESVENAAEIKMAVKKTLLGELPLESDLENLNRGKPKKRLDSAKKENLEPPAKEIWVLEKPNISALQDDIIKLSAQFVARNGRAFQSGLLEREHKNSQFGFLQPYHPLHQYFKKLVTDYTRILLPERGTIERLQELSSDKQAIINSVMKKAHWEKAQKKTEEEKRKEEEAERNAMALIDWHDFTVVQTIEWDDEEEEEIEEEGPNEPEIIPPPPQPTLPPKPPVEPIPQQQLPKAVPQNEESDDMDVGEDDEFSQEAQRTDLPVRHDYNPRDVRTSGSTTLKYITPSGQQIYPAEAEITMRIELSNSKVIEQRKAEAMNERDSNLAEGEEISRHLKNFVKNRNDIFGDELGLPEEPKKPVIEKPTWDGHSSSIQRVAMEALNGVNMQQIKALHDSKIYSGELSEPTIGPKLATTTRTPNATITTRPPEPARPQPPAPPRPQPIIPPSYSGTLPPFQPPMIRPPFPIQLPSHFNPPRLPPMMTTMPPIPKEDAEEPPMKRAKIKEKKDEITKNLISEKEFLDTHPGSVNIVIKVPNQPPGSTKWPPHLNGQTYRVQVNTSDNIKTLKQKLADLLGMPANKQKLRAEGLGFLKDAKTLAFYNATDNIEVELGVKERGGRKK